MGCVLSSLFTTKITGAKLRRAPIGNSWYTFNGPNSFDDIDFFSNLIPENIKCLFKFWSDVVDLENIIEIKDNPAEKITKKIEHIYDIMQTRELTEKELGVFKKLKDQESILEAENRHYKIERFHSKSERHGTFDIESYDYLIFYHSGETLDIVTVVTLYKIINDMNIPPKKVILIFADESAEKTHDRFCERNNIVNRIHVIGTCLFEFRIRYEFTMDYFNKYYPIIRDSILNKKPCKNRFFSFISRDKPSRKKLIEVFDEVENFNISNLAKGKVLDPWNFKEYTTPDGVTKTIDELYAQDFKFDTETEGNMNKYIYFADNICWTPHQEQLYKLYVDYYIEIVCESNTEDDQYLFLSEKIYKPLYYGQPFGLLGNRFSLELLRKLGYETFPEIFDESYDTYPTWQKRFDSLASDIKRLLALSDKDFENIIYSVGDKSMHNIHNFFEGEIGMENLRSRFYNIMKSDIKPSTTKEFDPPEFIKKLQK